MHKVEGNAYAPPTQTIQNLEINLLQSPLPTPMEIYVLYKTNSKKTDKYVASYS